MSVEEVVAKIESRIKRERFFGYAFGALALLNLGTLLSLWIGPDPSAAPLIAYVASGSLATVASSLEFTLAKSLRDNVILLRILQVSP